MEMTSAATPVVVTTGAAPVVMTNTVRVEATAPPPQALPGVSQVRRAEAGEQWIARLLRVGSLCSGGLFLASVALEALPDSESVHVAIDVLRKGAASALLVTPVVRLVVAGTTLGLRGEWKYALYAAGVLGLLAVAVGAGLHA
jgi:hypothetical protein